MTGLTFLLFLVTLFVVTRVLAANANLRQQLELIEIRLRQLERALKPPEVKPTPEAKPAPSTSAQAPSPSEMPPRPAVPHLPPRPVVTPASSTASHAAQSLEAEIGSRWMLAAGVIVLVLGVAFFVKYAFDRHWITETARVVIGTLVGAAVSFSGLIFVRRGYAAFGRAIAGAGFAMLFLSAWAATALYSVVSEGIGFTWVVAVSAVSGITALRHKSLPLALMALVFAYAAPFLVPVTRDQHLTLFLYEGILAAVVLFVIQRHGWPVLSLIAFWLTWSSFAEWSSQFYRADLFASTEIFLTFIVVTFAAMARRHARSSNRSEQLAALALRVSPFLYHVSSVAILFSHRIWFLLYVVTASAVLVGIEKDRPIARSLAWIAVAIPLGEWMTRYAGGAWFIPALLTIAGVYALHLIGQVRGMTPEAIADSELALFHVNSLGSFGLAYLALNTHGASAAPAAALFAVWNFALGWISWRYLRAAYVHFVATASTLITIFTAITLSGVWLTAALGAEGFVIAWFGLRADRIVFRIGGGVLIAAAIARLLSMELGRTYRSFVPILNARTLTGAFLVALLYGLAALYRRSAPSERRDTLVVATTVAANLLTLVLITADLDSYWTLRADEVVSADLARHLSISVAWGLYAMGVILLGFLRGAAPLRRLALGLFGVTLVKMFAVDLRQLDGPYRIAGFIVLGLALLSASFLYQRYRTRFAS